MSTTCQKPLASLFHLRQAARIESQSEKPSFIWMNALVIAKKVTKHYAKEERQVESALFVLMPGHFVHAHNRTHVFDSSCSFCPCGVNVKLVATAILVDSYEH